MPYISEETIEELFLERPITNQDRIEAACFAVLSFVFLTITFTLCKYHI